MCNGPEPETTLHRSMNRNRVKRSAMNLLKKLQNPFALVGQGFVVGGILFFTTTSQSSEAAAPAAPAPVEFSVTR